MSLLITGGAGFIGAHVALLALDRGCKVVVVDNLSTGFRDAVPADAVWAPAEVGDTAAIAAIMHRHGVTAVLHFAGSSVAPESVAKPLDYYDNNAALMISLLRACSEADVRRLVFSSSAAVYGEAQARVDEAAATLPVSPYGRSKLMAEIILRDAVATSGARAVALRYFNVAGADPKGRAGQSTVGATHLFKIACRVALGLQATLPIYGGDWPTRDGAGVRDYVHVDDLARAHLLALERLEAQADGTCEVYNLGSERGWSVREVACAVGRAAGTELACELRNRRAGDMAELVADSSLARSRLGWTSRFDLDAMATHALAWERRLAGCS